MPDWQFVPVGRGCEECPAVGNARQRSVFCWRFMCIGSFIGFLLPLYVQPRCQFGERQFPAGNSCLGGLNCPASLVVGAGVRGKKPRNSRRNRTGLWLALSVAKQFVVSVMTALSLIQSLIPTAPSAQSGTPSSTGQSLTKGQGSATNPFAMLMPGAGADGSSAGFETATDTGTTVLVPGAGDNNPATDLVSMLAGSQVTAKNGAETVGVEADLSDLTPALDAELVVDGLEKQTDGTEALAAPGPVPVQSNVGSDTGVPGASTANGVTAQAPASGSSPTAQQPAAPIDPEAALKAAAPQTQAGNGPAQPGAAAAASPLQVQGDVLEGGDGAPTAQKLLGIADPKAVTETAQKDPAAATLIWGANKKNGTNGANGNGATQNPFLSSTQNSSNVQPAFHEGQPQSDLPDVSAQKTPPPPVAAAQPRFDVAAQQTAGLDASVTSSDTPDGLVVGEQRPPVTVTVRFDQTIHGPQMAAQNLAMHIKRNFANGVNRFEVRLDPPELGRIDVRLDMNSDGRVSAALTVDRPETLDLLQRDARLLQKALQDAGINLEDSNLNFSLRDGDGQAAQQENGQSGGTGLDGGSLTETDDESLIEVPEQVAIIENDRIDIRI